MQRLKRTKARTTDAEMSVRRVTPCGGCVLPEVSTFSQLRRRRIGSNEVNKLAGRVEHDRHEQGVIGAYECELVEPEHIGPSKADSLRNAERL